MQRYKKDVRGERQIVLNPYITSGSWYASTSPHLVWITAMVMMVLSIYLCLFCFPLFLSEQDIYVAEGETVRRKWVVM